MKKSMFNTLLVSGGFLLGTAGVKLLKSEPVKSACVQGVACGIRLKNGYMVAKATYITESEVDATSGKVAE